MSNINIESATDARACVHARRIDASPERVFRAIADPDRLARWWGPKGFSSTIEVFDFRPGGTWRLVMHGPDGNDYANESVFQEVSAEQVVIEHLGGLHHFLLTITLTPEGKGTRVGWRQVFDTVEHRERVAPVVLQANEQNLDRLEAEVHRVP